MRDEKRDQCNLKKIKNEEGERRKERRKEISARDH
jgi:hypothetical protein